MFGIDKNTIENILIVLASVLLFLGISNAPVIGKYITEQPLWMIAAGVIFIAFSDKISKSIPIDNKSAVKSFVYLVSAVLIFHGVVGIAQISKYFKLYPLWIIAIALIIILFKDRVANSLGD